MTGRAKAELITLVVLVAPVVTFVLQNLDPVKIRLFFWSIEMSGALLVLILFVVGAIAGWILANVMRNRPGTEPESGF